ncbi:MAG TPA: hypothetical protein GX506_08450 [Firmicutes bacterium]|nr:hypothetical protein [Bacillota bacterium]
MPLVVLLTLLLAVGLGIGLIAQAKGTTTATEQSGENCQAGNQAEDSTSGGAEPSYTASIAVPQEESAKLASLAKISIDQAIAKALEANPGTTVVKAELDDENGYLVYSVGLNNGLDVKVDAGTGQIVHVDKDTAEDGENGSENEKDDEGSAES